MNVLDKLRRLSKKKTFDELPDMRQNGALENFELKKLADQCAEKIVTDGKTAGYENIEVKVVAIGVYIMVLNPNDKTRQEMALSPMVIADKEISFEDIMAHSALLRDTDASKIVNPESEPEYKVDSKYEGHMYG